MQKINREVITFIPAREIHQETFQIKSINQLRKFHCNFQYGFTYRVKKLDLMFILK